MQAQARMVTLPTMTPARRGNGRRSNSVSIAEPAPIMTPRGRKMKTATFAEMQQLPVFTNPLDFQFFELSDIKQLADVQPRNLAEMEAVLKHTAAERKRRDRINERKARQRSSLLQGFRSGNLEAVVATIPDEGAPPQDASPRKSSSPASSPRAADGRPRTARPLALMTTAIRLSNNQLPSIGGLRIVLMARYLRSPSHLLWLDLSFNRLESVEPELLAFPNLQSLCLHGNRIRSMKAQLTALAQLTTLRKLTLHGNPIEKMPQYRQQLALALPGLRMLDFSALTRQEKDNAVHSPRGCRQRSARAKAEKERRERAAEKRANERADREYGARKAAQKARELEEEARAKR